MNFSQCIPYFEQEILRLDKEAEGFGLHPLLGEEIEFREDRTNIKAKDAEALRAKAIVFLEDLISRAPDHHSAAMLKYKLDAVRHFSPYDLLMFYLHDMNPKTRKYLQPAFGYGEYTDEPGTYELRLKPMPPQEWIKACHTIDTELNDIAAQLGGAPITKSTMHLSISLSDKNGNLFSISHPGYPRLAGMAAEGITRALYDAIGMFIDPAKDRSLFPINCLPSRFANLRIAKDRIELRVPYHNREGEELARAYVLLSGALFGTLREYYEKKSLFNSSRPIHSYQARFKLLFAKGSVSAQPEYIKTLLGGSILDTDGQIRLDESYLLGSVDNIASDIAGIPISIRFSDEGIPRIHYLFSHLRVIEREGRLLFSHSIPESSPAYGTVNALVQLLNERLPIQGRIEIPVVEQGYRIIKASDMDTWLEGKKRPTVSLGTSIIRFRESPVFRRTTDPTAFEAISQAYLGMYGGKPSAMDREYDRILEQENAKGYNDIWGKYFGR